MDTKFVIGVLLEQFEEDSSSSCCVSFSCDTDQSSLAFRKIYSAIAKLLVDTESKWATDCAEKVLLAK